MSVLTCCCCTWKLYLLDKAAYQSAFHRNKQKIIDNLIISSRLSCTIDPKVYEYSAKAVSFPKAYCWPRKVFHSFMVSTIMQIFYNIYCIWVNNTYFRRHFELNSRQFFIVVWDMYKMNPCEYIISSETNFFFKKKGFGLCWQKCIFGGKFQINKNIYFKYLICQKIYDFAEEKFTVVG